MSGCRYSKIVERRRPDPLMHGFVGAIFFEQNDHPDEVDYKIQHFIKFQIF